MIYVQMIVVLGRRFKMIDSYKNIERLRYRLNKDLLAIYEDIKKDNTEQRVMFIDECFSAVASSFAALFFSQSTFEPMRKILRQIYELWKGETASEEFGAILTSVLSVVLLIFISVQINKLLLALKRRKRNKGPEGRDTIDYIKEFDNIACDSIFAAIEYKKLYFVTKDVNEKTLYYLETVHYLETASIITKKLCFNQLNIKSSNNVLGVDIYRIHNLKSIMITICKFLKDENEKLALDFEDKKEIKKQLKSVEKEIMEINI